MAEAPADLGFVEIDDGDTTWRFERDFMTSNWTCLFGNGCKGILAEEAEALNQGCCSLGAHFGDGEPGQEEARQLSAYVPLLSADQWQYHGIDTVYGDAERTHTRVVDGACVFLNRPGFAGGEGCALAHRRGRGRRVTDRMETVGVLATPAARRLGTDRRIGPCESRNRNGPSLVTRRLGRPRQEDGLVLHRADRWRRGLHGRR